MKVEVLEDSYAFSTYGMAGLPALSVREELFPVQSAHDGTYALVYQPRTGIYLDLRGDGLTFTEASMSGSVTSVTVIEHATDKLVRYSSLDIALGSPEWGDAEAMFSGRDTVTGSKVSDDLYGLGGDDVINGRGGGDVIHGGVGDDKLVGGNGNDQVFGDGGDDLIVDGGGNDLMTGGGGRDAFRFKGTTNSPDGNTITDFGRGNDRIELDRDAFSRLGPKGALDPGDFGIITKSGITNPNAKILYDAWNSQLYYDRDGSGGKAMKLIATVFGNDPSVHLGADDIFIV